MSDHAQPDFLGIGAPRAGTTWLWTVLRAHPQIWMPPRKELHYFTRGEKYHSPAHLQKETLSARLLGPDRSSQKFRRVLATDLYYLLTGRNKLSEIPWLMRYHFGRINDDWYRSLFDGQPGLVKGEITPDYCMLDQQDVEHIHSLLPDLKVIYSIRNPVERSWSHFRFGVGRRGREINDQRIERFKERLRLPAHRAINDYAGTIQRWRSVLPEGQFMLVFQEQIEREPGALVRALYQFLGVDEALQPPANLLKSKVNASAEKEIPLDFRRMMVAEYYPQVVELNKMIGGYTAEWLAEYEQYV